MFGLAATSVFLGAVFFLLCFWFVRRPKNLPPGPWSLPIIGYRFGPGPIHEAFMDLAKKYGPIFSLRRGTFLFVVLNDIESMKQALVKSAEFFSDRFVPGQVKCVFPDSKHESIAFSNGKPWDDIRKFSLPALRSFGFGKQSLVPQINLECRFMADEIRNLKGTPSDLTSILNKATANVITQLLFNRRYDYDDVEFINIIQAFRDMVGVIPETDPVNVFGHLIHSNKPHYNRFREAVYTIRNFMNAHVKRHEETFQENHSRDLIDAFLAHSISKEMKPEDFRGVLMVNFFAGGQETTAVEISWTMVYMAVHPDVQRKVQAELDAVVGHGRQPSTSDRQNLPYCDATLMEVMRICPALPNSVPHKTSADVTLRGYTIPKDSIVIPNIWGVHHDLKEWEDPELFNPDRFLSDDGKTVVKKEAYIPFGIGRRDCVGSQLAKMETFLLFTNLSQQFEFKFPPDEPTHSLECVTGMTMYPTPYKICAIER